MGVEVGGSAQNLTKFQMVPIPILSVLTCSTSSSHDILKVKKTTNTCLVGGTNTMGAQWLRYQNDPATTQPLYRLCPTQPIVKTAGFFYARTTKINNVKFAHQSVCNSPIALLMKAIWIPAWSSELGCTYSAKISLGQPSYVQGTYEKTTQGYKE